jgi:hypothetical protein
VRPPYRQGDILLVAVETMPKSVVRIEPESGRLILARGETNGHHHSVAEIDAEGFATAGTARQAEMYLKVWRQTALEHQEHDAQVLTPGIYRVHLKREYVPGQFPRPLPD